jgi:hypothetical protein
MMEAFPDRDARLGAALRDACGDVPEIDFAALRGRIGAQAELPLARMRTAQPRRWRPIRALIPLAAAAGIGSAAFALTRPQEKPLTQADRQQVEQILNATTPALSDLVAGQNGSEDLLNAALGS